MLHLHLLLLRRISSAQGLALKGKLMGKLAMSAALTLALAHTAARADVVFYEPFDYTDGQFLSGQSGGTGFTPGSQWVGLDGTTAGDPSGTIDAASSLSYTDPGGKELVTTGGHYVHEKIGSGIFRRIDVDALATSNPGVVFEDTTRFTPGNHIGKDGSTVWVSFIYQSAYTGTGGGWGGLSFQDGDENNPGHDLPTPENSDPFAHVASGTAGNHGDEARHDFGFSLPPDPTLDGTGDDFEGVRRMLRGFDIRGDMGGEKRPQDDLEGPVFALSAHRGRTSKADPPSVNPLNPLVNADPPTFVLMRMDFQGDPSDPNTNTVASFDNPGENAIEPNEFYETWPKVDEADQIRLWLNPSLTSEPALGTEAILFDYQSESSVLEFATQDLNNLNPANREEHYFADRFDFKLDSVSMGASTDGTVYDELRMGTTFGDVTPVVGGGLAGDFDGDGDVDGADFLKWQRDDGTAGGLSDWQSGYGTGTLAAAASVPEPTTLALGLLGLAGLAAGRRRRS